MVMEYLGATPSRHGSTITVVATGMPLGEIVRIS